MPINRSLPDNQLPFLRTQEYLRTHRHSAMLAINAVLFEPIQITNRARNFAAFVKLYMDVVPFRDLDFDKHGVTRLTSTSSGYKSFETYASTDYGSAVIAEMVDNHERYKGFKIKETREFDIYGDRTSAGGSTSAFSSIMFLPEKFPSKTHYPVGGQPIDPVAVIHHEFYHTVLRYGFIKKNIILDDEREAVIFAENPARIVNKTFNGFTLEPRYSYYRKDFEKTINIMTGEQLPEKLTTNKYDITKLVYLNDPKAL